MATYGAAHAEQGGVELGVAGPVDYATHRRTYQGFLRLLKYAMGAVAIILILMALFLT